MFLGEYLLKNDVINKSQLVESIIKQYRSIPPVVEILLNNKLLEEDNIIELVNININDAKDPLVVLKDQFKFSDEQIQNIKLEQDKKVKGLLEILVEDNIIGSADIGELVKDYKKMFDKNEEVPVKKKEVEGGLSAAALESLQEIGGLSEDLISDFENKKG